MARYAPVAAWLLQPKGRAVRVMHDKTPTVSSAVVRDDKTMDLFGAKE